MLAKRRTLRLGSSTGLKTPLLLPSFSSKGFPKVQKIFKACEEYISDEILVSAYDVFHKRILPPFDFASVIFLDSGGYEASKDADLSEIYEGDHVSKDWSPEMYSKLVKGWTSVSPTVFVSFDHPKHRMSTKEQIDRARKLVLPSGDHGRSILLKPETEQATRIQLEKVVPLINQMKDFVAIGVTEKEIGNSFLSRMLNIARLRRAIDAHHIDMPIHVFGSLDTISTYLFFLAGADIFDGLTWLRYAFTDGDTIYRHSYGATQLPLNTNSDIVEGRCWSNNYQYMQQMRLNMKKYINDGDFKHFGKHGDLIRGAYQSMCAELAEER